MRPTGRACGPTRTAWPTSTSPKRTGSFLRKSEHFCGRWRYNVATPHAQETAMIAVIFEVWPKPELKQQYLDLAAELRPILETIDGFISIERFESLTEKGKILSLSFFRDEEAVAAWRNIPQHRKTQAKGRARIFDNYRLRIAGVIRDYGMQDRAQAPQDSRATHDAH